jgi:hypothetical protein
VPVIPTLWSAEPFRIGMAGKSPAMTGRGGRDDMDTGDFIVTALTQFREG